MNAAERAKLIDDLIREDSESTVRDYLNCLSEIEQIEGTLPKPVKVVPVPPPVILQFTLNRLSNHG